MTFEPVLPVWLLVTIAIVLTGVRMTALYRVLVRTGPGRYRPVVLRWSGLTLAVLMLVVAAARPGLEAKDAHPDSPPPNASAASTANLNVFFVIDRSVDTRVEDFADRTSRLAGIRDDVVALIDQYPRARFSAIGFASKATELWPLSDDAWSLKPLIQGLSSYTEVPEDAMYRVDSGAANDTLRTALTVARSQHKGSKNVVFYLGCGAAGSRAAQTAFTVKDLVSGGAVLGYGTPAGGPIPRGYIDGNLIYMADQQSGAPLTNGIGEDTLKARASDLEVTYHHRDKGQSISPVVPAVTAEPPPDAAPLQASQTVERTELYWLFSLLAATFVAIEIYLTARDYRRARQAGSGVTP
ncbi:VWA domain-containing protein [Candidatus Mycobacterium wuenschmannii]|uniref:VWA domain-containing protein n=1 Tax=Candidatus Mycobacterium wuenschmannii TaxID=3027808 RepID=A0ABY8W444_9MYCO|nr:VWA domain-containing protein [Candidatus Mycobacterium wuenschmannii]WIM89826.1 VWA domain-containing protein [Candidatus Mycobacterium wuenschmannii]